MRHACIQSKLLNYFGYGACAPATRYGSAPEAHTHTHTHTHSRWSFRPRRFPTAFPQPISN